MRVGGQASGQGASPRPRSWTSAGLPGSREPPSTVATCPRHGSRPGLTSIPCPAASPEPGSAGALEGGSCCPPHGLIHAPAIHGDHVVRGHVLDEELLPPQGHGAPPAAQCRGPGALLAPQTQHALLQGGHCLRALWTRESDQTGACQRGLSPSGQTRALSAGKCGLGQTRRQTNGCAERRARRWPGWGW